MTWLASLTRISEGELDRLIKRIAAILLLGTLVFVGFYLLDRFRMPTTPMVDQQLAALEQAVRDDASDIAARGQLADLYVAKGRFDEAIVQYTAILETGKAEELARMGRARAYMGLERYDDAAADYMVVVDIAKGGEMANVDPTLESAYYQLGAIALKQDQPAEAIPFLEKALAIKRSDADALYLIGQAFVLTGRTDEAETVLRAAVAFVPIGWPEPYTVLAEAYSNAGKADLAEWAAAMAELAQEKPDLAEPRLKAITDGEAALDAAIGLGLLYETKGDTASAALWYETALAKDPANDSARLGLSRVGSVPTPAPTLPAPGAGEVTVP